MTVPVPAGQGGDIDGRLSRISSGRSRRRSSANSHSAARGKDLVADQVRRLERDITAARNRLDAMRWNS